MDFLCSEVHGALLRAAANEARGAGIDVTRRDEGVGGFASGMASKLKTLHGGKTRKVVLWSYESRKVRSIEA